MAERQFVPIDLVSMPKKDPTGLPIISAGNNLVALQYTVPQGKALEIKTIEVVPDFNKDPANGPIGASGLDYAQLEVNGSGLAGHKWFINGAWGNQLPPKNGASRNDPQIFGLTGAELWEMFRKGEITEEQMRALARIQLTPKIRNSVTVGLRLFAFTKDMANATDWWTIGVTEPFMVRIRGILYESDAIIKKIWGEGANIETFDTLPGGTNQGDEVMQYYNVLLSNKNAISPGEATSLEWYPNFPKAAWSLQETEFFKIEEIGQWLYTGRDYSYLWIDGTKQYPAQAWNTRNLNNILPMRDEDFYGNSYKLEPALTIRNMTLEYKQGTDSEIDAYVARTYIKGTYLRLRKETIQALGLE